MNGSTNTSTNDKAPAVPADVVWLAPRSSRCTVNADKAKAATAKADSK